MTDIREVSILVKDSDANRRVFKIAFTSNDMSIYIFPYGITKRYFYGGQAIPEQAFSHSFDWEDIFAETTPKLSIHETGQVHIKCEGTCAGPLYTLPLSQFRGEHLATVSLDTLDSCPEDRSSPRTSGKSRDVMVPVDDGVRSARFIVYANGSQPNFPVRCPILVNLARESIPFPLHIGIAPVAQAPLGHGSPERKGTTTIAGWNPREEQQGHLPFLFLRSE